MARILIVENEHKLRHTLRRGLEEGGYDVVAVEGGGVPGSHRPMRPGSTRPRSSTTPSATTT
jgi:CheY-like chemotaxis protein